MSAKAKMGEDGRGDIREGAKTRRPDARDTSLASAPSEKKQHVNITGDRVQRMAAWRERKNVDTRSVALMPLRELCLVQSVVQSVRWWLS